MRPLWIFFLALLLAPAAADAATCGGGKVLYRAHGITVVDIERYYHHPSLQGYSVFYACRGGVRWKLDYGDPYSDYSLRDIHLQGHRLGFIEDVDADVYIGFAGWTDIRTHRTRIGIISYPEGPDGAPDVPIDRNSYAIASDGAMAVLGGDVSGEQKVAILDPSPKSRRFRRCRILFAAPKGGIVYDSLRIDRAEVSFSRKDQSIVTVDRD